MKAQKIKKRKFVMFQNMCYLNKKVNKFDQPFSISVISVTIQIKKNVTSIKVY